MFHAGAHCRSAARIGNGTALMVRFLPESPIPTTGYDVAYFFLGAGEGAGSRACNRGSSLTAV